MGSYKWAYKALNMGCKYRYPTYNPTYNYPCTSKQGISNSGTEDSNYGVYLVRDPGGAP